MPREVCRDSSTNAARVCMLPRPVSCVTRLQIVVQRILGRSSNFSPIACDATPGLTAGGVMNPGIIRDYAVPHGKQLRFPGRMITLQVGAEKAVCFFAFLGLLIGIYLFLSSLWLRA